MRFSTPLIFSVLSSIALSVALPASQSSGSLNRRDDLESLIKSADNVFAKLGDDAEDWLRSYYTGKFANLPVINSTESAFSGLDRNSTESTLSGLEHGGQGGVKIPIHAEGQTPDTDVSQDVSTAASDLKTLVSRGLMSMLKGKGKGKGKTGEHEHEHEHKHKHKGKKEKGEKKKSKDKMRPTPKDKDSPPGVVKGKHQGFCGWPKKSYPKSMGGGTDGRMFCIFASRAGVCTSCVEGKNKEHDECWC